MALHWKGLVKWAARPKFQLRSDLSVVDLQFQTNPGSISQGRTIYLCLTAYTLGETCISSAPMDTLRMQSQVMFPNAIKGGATPPQQKSETVKDRNSNSQWPEQICLPLVVGQLVTFLPFLTTKQRHHCRTGHPSRPTSACNRQSLSHEKKPWRPRFELQPLAGER